MSIKLELLAGDWYRATAELQSRKAQLEQHLASDFMKVKERFEAGLTHFSGEVARLEYMLPVGVLRRLQAGHSAEQAVEMHLEAEKSAAELPASVPGYAGDPP